MSNEKLVKLLSLTTSENEHEALNAIRAANKLIRERQMQWKDLVGAPNSSAGKGRDIFKDIQIRQLVRDKVMLETKCIELQLIINLQKNRPRILKLLDAIFG